MSPGFLVCHQSGSTENKHQSPLILGTFISKVNPARHFGFDYRELFLITAKQKGNVKIFKIKNVRGH